MSFQTNLVWPLTSDMNLSLHLIENTQIGEFYAGIRYDSNNTKGGSFSHHFSERGCIDTCTFNKLSLAAEKNGKKINLAFNVFYFSDKLLHSILCLLEQIDICQIYSFVIANLELAMQLKTYFPSIKFSASSLLGIRSIHSVLFMEELGFQRIIFPRTLSIENILLIAATTKKRMEFEAFIWGGGCSFEESTCHLPHVRMGDSSQPLAKIEMRPICRYACRTLNTGEMGFINFGSRYCGICYMQLLKESGINRFKVTGRTNTRENLEQIFKKIDSFAKITPESCLLGQGNCLYGCAKKRACKPESANLSHKTASHRCGTNMQGR